MTFLESNFPKVEPRLLIGGVWRGASDQGMVDVSDPATGALIATVSDGAIADGIAAVDAAAGAANTWASSSPRHRADVLRRCYELMLEHREPLEELIVLEAGKSRGDARGEVDYAAEFFRWFAEEAVRTAGILQTAPGGDKRIMTMLQPVGVSLLVTPWNFPAAMVTRKLAPALAAGCTVVVKPATDTPLCALAIAGLMAEAGVPDGVVNVVPSSRSSQVVAAMLDHPATRKLSFTGSTRVGSVLLRQAADRIVNCSMELGGNGPFLVFADSDLDAAVEGAMLAKLRNAGESCIAANRFYVEEPAADGFVAALAERMDRVAIGPGTDVDNEIGPMINGEASEAIAELVQRSVEHGSDVVLGGSAISGAGNFFAPTVLSNVRPDDPILAAEIFGPVAPVVRFGSEEEAVRLSNATPYGLAGYVYTSDLSRALRVAEQLEVGMVGVNRGLISDPAAPFGGVKQSGLGREGGYEGILEFLETKYIALDW